MPDYREFSDEPTLEESIGVEFDSSVVEVIKETLPMCRQHTIDQVMASIQLSLGKAGQHFGAKEAEKLREILTRFAPELSLRFGE